MFNFKNKTYKIKIVNNHLIIKENDTNIKVVNNVIKNYYNANKKVSSTVFASLIGINKWQSVGLTVLDFLGITRPLPIDPFYMKRGEIAENLTVKYLTSKLIDKYPQHEIMYFKLSDFPNYDQFPNNKYFSGVTDIIVKKNKNITKNDTLEKRLDNVLIFEVKSKSKSNYDSIITNELYPEHEIAQGQFLAMLNQKSIVLLVWVFFDEACENKIKLDYDNTLINTLNYNDVIIKIKEFKFNIDDLQKKAYLVYDMLVNIIKDKKIPLSLFSESEINYLKGHADEKN